MANQNIDRILADMRGTELKWLNEAADTLEQALAGQTYQYGVTYTGVNHGGDHISWIEPTGDPGEDAETLRLELAQWKRRSGQVKPNRIVRRRVGEIEVVE